MSTTVQLAQELIRKASVTPEDAGCQQLIAERLFALGFEITSLPFGDVRNLWARRGTDGPLFVYAGHTDVVPTGPLDHWKYPPFSATIDDHLLYGRGAADMKSSVAAILVAIEEFIQQHPDHQGSIGLLITSDEEGAAIDGTTRVIDYLEQNQIKIDWCLVGEPSSSDHVGDVIKNGRRGSIGCTLTVTGKQGHVAYPQLADNPIHRLSAILNDLAQTEWDQGNEFFPATTFQVSNIEAGTGADNVIPETARATFNLRYSTELTAEEIKTKVESVIKQYASNYNADWRHSGNPFLTEPGVLVNACCQAVTSVTGRTPQLSTAGGTSDGRFIAPTGAEVVELGVVNESIHKINEHTDTNELEQLQRIYLQTLKNLLL